MATIKFFILVLIIIMAGLSIFRKIDNEDVKKILPKIKIIVYGAFGAIVVIFSLFSSIYFTSEQEIGFVSFFGRNTMIEGPGMHFKIPFISDKHIYDSTTKGMPIGYSEETDESKQEESLMITSDFNFVNTDFYIEYRIVDPIEYHYGSNDAEGILRNVAQAAIRNTVGRYDVDSVITTGKNEIESKVFEEIVEGLEKHHTGISVSNVTIQDSEPPTTAVIDAFKAVENAKQEAETAVNDARKYQNEQIPAAEAEAEQVKQAATATQTERINSAKEEVAKFEALYNEYKNNPETVKQRLYYEALQEILPNMEIIIGKDAKVIYVKEGTNEATKDSIKLENN